MANLVFWVFKPGSCGFAFIRVILTHGGFLGFGNIQFEVFGLEVGSSAFPTSFRRVVRFVASWTFWIFFRCILPVIASLFFLSLEFSAVSFDMPGFFAIVASDIWVDARRKEVCTRSCCCRGCGHCGDMNVVTLLVSSP